MWNEKQTEQDHRPVYFKLNHVTNIVLLPKYRYKEIIISPQWVHGAPVHQKQHHMMEMSAGLYLISIYLGTNVGFHRDETCALHLQVCLLNACAGCSHLLC